MHDALERSDQARVGAEADFRNLKQAFGSLQDVEKQTANAKVELSQAEALRTAARHDLADLSTQIASARSMLSTEQEAANEKVRNLQIVDAATKAAADQLAALQSQSATTRSQIADATADRDTSVAAVESAKKQLADLQGKIDTAGKYLNTVEDKTASVLNALTEKAHADLLTEIQTLQKQLADSKAVRANQESELSTLKAQLGDSKGTPQTPTATHDTESEDKRKLNALINGK